MRMMMKVQIPVAAGNEAIRNGSLEKAIEGTMERVQPEAAYFTVEDGVRTALFFFDLGDQSQMPVIGEPLFMAFDAQIDMTPCMNGDDLRKGLAAWGGA